MKHRSLVPALIAGLLVSCDEAFDVSVEPGGYVAGSGELDGRINAVTDKSLYPAMEIAVKSRDFSTPAFLYDDEPWFVLSDGDRIRLLEVDEDEKIARVEVLTGFLVGATCWVSLDCVNLD